MLLSFMRTWRATGLCSNQQQLLLCKQQVRLMYVLLLLMYKMVMSIHLEGGREGGSEAFKVLTSWFS